MEWRYRLDEISKAAIRLWDEVKDQPVVAFNGEMGTGKTTMIQSLCLQLGVKDKMSSPTFSIINEYSSPNGLIYHIDLYRCENEEEAIRAGVEECLYSGYTCFVEWPSKAPGIFPPDLTIVTITMVDDKTRTVDVSKSCLKEQTPLNRNVNRKL